MELHQDYDSKNQASELENERHRQAANLSKKRVATTPLKTCPIPKSKSASLKSSDRQKTSGS